MYNAVVYHYFDVGPNLELTRVLARETRVVALEPSEGLFVRELTQLTPRRLRMETVRDALRKTAKPRLCASGQFGTWHAFQGFPMSP